MAGYGTDQGLVDYAASRGYTLPAGDKPSARQRGSDALDAMYAERWVGEKADYTQERAWPRLAAAWPDGTTITGIPEQVVLASYEASYREMVTPGFWSPIVTPGKVKRRARVEGAVDVEYARDWTTNDLTKAMIPVSGIIEGLLYGLVGTRTSLPGILVV